MAKNDFESMIYKLRDWLREDENQVYVQEAKREALIEKLAEHEDWLYEAGDDVNHTVFHEKYRKLAKDYETFTKRKEDHSGVTGLVEQTISELEKINVKLVDLQYKKPWITD